ncbi:MAG TPA: kinase/pyrophosphorylase, partial [Xanthomonadales bacterium]|nr:kinase/pyrophosphorylase [Xanthomonadales bacterium]
MKRTVFFVSDGTAITTETLGHSLLTQFPDIDFEQERLPFVNDLANAAKAVTRINDACKRDKAPAIVFNTIVDAELCDIIHRSDGIILDLFQTFLGPLEKALGTRHLPTVGRAHGMSNSQRYEDR